MTTLIVGCGYLGRRVAARLLARGERVIGTTRSPQWASSLAGFGIIPVVFDVLGSSFDLPDFDRLVYCIGYDRGSGRAMREVYVDGLRRFFERAPAFDRFVYTSSTGVYGQDDGSWVTEDDPAEPRHESGRICLDAEHEARDKGATVVRLAGLYGPGRIIRRAAILAGEPISGDPDRPVNLVQIDDAATATIAALDRGVTGLIYNVADDRPPSRRELYTITAQLLDAPAPTFVAGHSSREESNRRISNHRMKDDLAVALAYPDITTGLPASVSAEG